MKIFTICNHKIIKINIYLFNKLYIFYYNILNMTIKLLAQYFLSLQFGGDGYKWTTLRHNGVLFPPLYKYNKIPLIYNGKEYILNPLAEEYLSYYVKYLNTDYIKKSQFKKNFWKDFKKILKNDEIKSLDNCDFKYFIKYLENKQKIEKNINDDELYKFAYIDNKEISVGNFRIEPPGIFLGRGNHPKLGKIKFRIFPEDVILNLDKSAPIPKTLEGHKWGKIIHDRNVEWLASWKDVITGKNKYVWLGNDSEFKMKSDIEKFDLARKLKKKINTIRKENDTNLKSSDNFLKQLSSALYLIDALALRVGNEKSEDESDTVGVTSLRVEHITVLDNNKIKLDFYGKDSVRYVKEIEVQEIVYNNIKEFIKNKNKNDNLFDLINSNLLNKYLQNFMPELTAKVFRTFKASDLFSEELNKITEKYEKYNKSDKIQLLLDLFNQANTKVACLCNHQKNVSKNYNEQVKKIKDRINILKEKLDDYKTRNKDISKVELMIKKLKRKKTLKKELKNLSLGTSKINYIDPRITISFMKKHNIPVEKIFTKTLIQKFKWAFDVDENWKF
jgi:DNA topoisomerase-1